MVGVVSKSGASVSEAEGAPRHGSSERETLDVPSERRSRLTGRLSMLNLGKQDNNVGVPTAGGAGGASSSGRSRWEAVREERRDEGPSLMEQMMAEAMAAKEEKAQEQRQEQLRDTKQSFGGGLKKGFLSQRAVPAASSAARKTKKGHRGKNEEQSSTASEGTSSGAQDNMPVITSKAAPSGRLEFDVSTEASGHPGLVLPEVQEAMNPSAADRVGGTGGAGGGQDWLTPELLDKISEKPRLAAMLTDLRFAKAMQLMSTSPQEALAMFASSPDARESFTELMSLLSKHFEAIGEAADKKAAAEEADRKRVAEGPLAQEALRRAEAGVGVAATPATAEEAATVEKILQQPELRELLMDPGMQKVLQECGDPRALERYMRHPDFGPKLKVMARAGLISFAA
eukprot:g6567.t1